MDYEAIITEAIRNIDDQIVSAINCEQYDRRGILMIMQKVASVMESPDYDSVGYVSLKVFECVREYCRSDPKPNYFSLQINKLINVENKLFAEFVQDVNLNGLRVLISEEKPSTSYEVDSREYVKLKCKICGCNEFEVMNGYVKKYYACSNSNCLMPY